MKKTNWCDWLILIWIAVFLAYYAVVLPDRNTYPITDDNPYAMYGG